MAEQHAHSKLVRAELVQQQNGRYQDLYQRQAVNTPWYATDEAEPCGKRLVERADLFCARGTLEAYSMVVVLSVESIENGRDSANQDPRARQRYIVSSHKMCANEF